MEVMTYKNQQELSLVNSDTLDAYLLCRLKFFVLFLLFCFLLLSTLSRITDWLILDCIEAMSIRIKTVYLGVVRLDVVVLLKNRDDFLNSLKFFLSKKGNHDLTLAM